MDRNFRKINCDFCFFAANLEWGCTKKVFDIWPWPRKRLKLTERVFLPAAKPSDLGKVGVVFFVVGNTGMTCQRLVYGVGYGASLPDFSLEVGSITS